MLKICITGHRDLINSEEVKNDVAYSLLYFKKFDQDLLAISALAKGADTLFADQAMKQLIPLKIILPFTVEEYSKDFTDQNDLLILEKYLQKNEFEIAQQKTITSAEERNQAYLLAGMRMVDLADIVLAVWDSKPANGKGGTGDIVHYAMQKGKEIHIIKGIRNTQIINEKKPDELQEKFDELDRNAVKFKNRKFEPAWISGIIAGVVAVFSFSINLAFSPPNQIKFMLACSELLFIFASFILLGIYAKKWKKLFLENRRGAEFLRTVLWYRDAGIPISPLYQTDFTPPAEILALKENAAGEFPVIRKFENAKRIAWCLAQEQIDYHQRTRIDRFDKKLEKTEFGLSLIKIIFFTAAPISFLIETIEHFGFRMSWNIETLKHVLIFLSLTLPTIYAALEGIKYFGEWKRNIAISTKIVNKLKILEEKIIQCNTEKELVILASELRNILEIENSDWAVRYDEKEVGAKV